MYFWGGASWRHSQSLRPNELIQWHAMKVGKSKGIRVYDMGGEGDYKRKYGGYEITVPWFRKSKYRWVRYAREMAERSHRAGRWCLGRYNRMVTSRPLRQANFRPMGNVAAERMNSFKGSTL
jgi:hypothetical protein